MVADICIYVSSVCYHLAKGWRVGGVYIEIRIYIHIYIYTHICMYTYIHNVICHAPTHFYTPQTLHLYIVSHKSPRSLNPWYPLWTPGGVLNSQYPGSVALKCELVTTRVSLLRFVFFGFFLQKTSFTLLKLWELEEFADPGTTLPKRSFHHWGLSPIRPNEFWTCPDDGATRAQASGCQRSSCWVRSKRKRRGPV